MTSSELPPNAKPGELSVREKAVTRYTFPDGGGVHVTKMGVRPVAIGKAKENRERRRHVIETAQAAVAQAALEGTRPTVLQSTAAAGNVDIMPDGSTVYTMPITSNSSFSVHPPVKTHKNEGQA